MNYKDSAILTVGMPFYNNKKTIGNAIRSVICQTYKNWELILIDDGSTDGSLEIAKSFSDTHSNIRLVSESVNKGLIFRLNQIIDLAQTKYIARMDSDDMMMPTRLEKQIKFLIAHPQVDIVDSAMYTIDQLDKPIGKRGTNSINTVDRKFALKGALLNHPTVIAKSSWYKMNLYSEDFVRAEDYELWCRTFMWTKFGRIQEPLLLYREGKVSVKNYNLSMITVRKIFKKYGPIIFTKQELKMEMIKTYLKSVIYTLMGFIGLQDYLSSKRNMILSNQEIELIDKTILFIKNS